MLLAGDVGGTKTRLGLFTSESTRPTRVSMRQFTTLDYLGLEPMVTEFLQEARSGLTLDAACFGVAGPVRGETARLTNVPWSIDAAAIAATFSIGRVALLNDLETMACSIPVLQPDEVCVLQHGQAVTGGNAALIAAGTGLGEAMLHHVDGRFVPAASEGGHADFAARTPRELDMVRELTPILGRVRCEDVLSGRGLVTLHRVAHREPCRIVKADLPPDQQPAAVSASGLDRRCQSCVEALDMFVEAYGAEAGNLALRTTATAGVYVGGGIAPRILPSLQSGRFMEAFLAKAPMGHLLAAMPVQVVLYPQPGLLGAATYANGMT